MTAPAFLFHTGIVGQTDFGVGFFLTFIQFMRLIMTEFY